MYYYITSILFIIIFTKGLTEIYGISSTVTQLIIDGIIVILFSLSFLRMLKHRRVKGPALILNFLLIIVVFLSFLLSSVTEMQMILFIRNILIYYLFFYALFNSNLNASEKDKLFKLLIFLAIIQVPAAFFKLMNIGTMEDYVGMMTIQIGSLGTIMPIMVISFLVAIFLEYKIFKIIFLILLFISIGLISIKMGILFYVIILFIILSYFFSYRHTGGRSFFSILFLKKISLVSVILLFIFVTFVSLNPRANPEGVVGGSVDLEYLIAYIDNYQNLKIKASRTEGDGRFEAPIVAFNKLESEGVMNILFGFGPGDIIKSKYTLYDNPLLQKYNIGYGGRLGLVYIMMQIGLIGVILCVLFHYIIFQKLWKIYRKAKLSKSERTIVLGSLGFPVIYFLDFFTYSSTLLNESSVTISYYYVIYYVLSKYKFVRG